MKQGTRRRLSGFCEIASLKQNVTWFKLGGGGIPDVDTNRTAAPGARRRSAADTQGCVHAATDILEAKNPGDVWCAAFGSTRRAEDA